MPLIGSYGSVGFNGGDASTKSPKAKYTKLPSIAASAHADQFCENSFATACSGLRRRSVTVAPFSYSVNVVRCRHESAVSVSGHNVLIGPSTPLITLSRVETDRGA